MLQLPLRFHYLEYIRDCAPYCCNVSNLLNIMIMCTAGGSGSIHVSGRVRMQS